MIDYDEARSIAEAYVETTFSYCGLTDGRRGEPEGGREEPDRWLFLHKRKGQPQLAGGPIAVDKQSGEVREIRFDEIAAGIDHDLARFIADRFREAQEVDGYLIDECMEESNRWLFWVGYDGDEVVFGPGVVEVDKVTAKTRWLTHWEEPRCPAAPRKPKKSAPFDLNNDTFWD